VNGVAICSAAGAQISPRTVSDGVGGAIVTWQDFRGAMSPDIYAQRVSHSGAAQWVTDGVPLCTADWEQLVPQIVSDGEGGAIVAWQDLRCGPLTFAQRIRASGEIVATMLQTYSAALDGSCIRIDWSLLEMDGDARFSIFRAAAPEWRFVELEGVKVDNAGLSFACTDASCLPGTAYKYRVECEAAGMPKRLLFETETITIPALPVTLYQNRPNPFNPRTAIRFYLPETREIVLDVYDVAGERVVRLAEGKREKGYHEVTWDGRNGSGTTCSSGVYFSRLTAGKSSISRKMIMLR
jgi:hypothetical protein